jgi:hypothetical protein
MIERGEMYAAEDARLASFSPLPDIQPGLFSGAMSAPFVGAKHALDVAASAAANTVTPILEKITPESMHGWLAQERTKANESLQATRPDPRTVGAVGQFLHGVTNVVGTGAAGFAAGGPVGAVAAIGSMSMYDKATELIEQNVDLETSLKVGAVTGVVMGGGAALPPFMGKTLSKQILSGVGLNVGLGMAERAWSAAILEDKYSGIAAHYQTIDATAMAVDAVLGAAFPVGARVMRRQSVANIDDAMEANRLVAEQSRNPALQATLEGIEKERIAAENVTKQILEGNRPLSDVETPAGVMEDIVPNTQFGETAAIAAKSIGDVMVAETGLTMKNVESEYAIMSNAFNKAFDRKQIAQGDLLAPTKEVTAGDIVKQEAQTIIENNPDMKVIDDNGNSVSAKELIAKADEQQMRDEQEASLYQVAVACFVGIGQ